MLNLPPLILYAVPFFLGTVLLESYFSYKEQRGFVEAKDSFTSIGLGLGNLFIGLITKSMVLVVFMYVYEQHRLFDWSWKLWPVWVFAFFAEDFTYYWLHRLAHEIRYFWASHLPHHSSPNYNLAAALRQSWTSSFSGVFLFFIWMPLLGIHPLIVFFFNQISLLYQYWIHTEFIKKMPNWFEQIFNTPSHHRVHHGVDLDYLDKNYGGILIIWDRLFGSFQSEMHRPSYGLTKQIESNNPAKIAFYEWVQLAKDVVNHPRYAWNYIFGPPGWSHDGSRKTVSQLRQSAKISQEDGTKG